jgi:rod shape-determining protein MreD
MVIVAQVSLLPALRPFGVVPDLVLVAVVLLGLRSTVSQALTLALVGGVVMDLSAGSDFGLHTGILVLAALSTGLVRRSGLTLIGPLVAIGLVVVITLVAAAVSLAAIIGSLSIGTTGPILAILLGELVLNLLLTLGVRPIIDRLVPDESVLPTIA